MLLPLDFM